MANIHVHSERSYREKILADLEADMQPTRTEPPVDSQPNPQIS